MDTEKIITEVQQFITNNIVSEEVIIEPDTLLQDAGIDSYSIVEIILFIERKYGLQVPNQMLVPENFESVNAIANTIQRLNNPSPKP